MNTRFPGPRALPRFFAAACLALVPVTFLSRLAGADEDTARREAQRRLEEAIKLHDDGKDEEARAKFIQAWAILKTPNVLFNLARTEQLSKHEVDAIRHYRLYLRMSDSRITENDRSQVRAYITELAPRLGHIKIAAPNGAMLFVDGWRVEVPAGEIVDVEAGKHLVLAKVRDQEKRVPVECPAGVEVTATVPEDPVVSPPPPPPAPVPTDITPKRTMFPPPTGAIVVGAVGVAALGVGIGYGVDASSKNSDVSNQRATTPCFVSTSPGCTNFKSAVSSAQQSATIADALFIGGGVALAGAIVWWLVAPRSVAPATTGVWVTPAVGAGDVGVRAVGRF